LEFTGLTKTDVENKKNDIEADLARALGVNADDVTIVSISVVDARRRRNLLGNKIVILYEVKVKDDSAATALKAKMGGASFKADVKKDVTKSLGVDESTITLTAKTPSESSISTSTTKSGGTVIPPVNASGDFSSSGPSSDQDGLTWVYVLVLAVFVPTCACILYRTCKKDSRREKAFINVKDSSNLNSWKTRTPAVAVAHVEMGVVSVGASEARRAGQVDGTATTEQVDTFTYNPLAKRTKEPLVEKEPRVPKRKSARMPDWAAYEDGEGNTYYWNAVTKESTWKRPNGF